MAEHILCGRPRRNHTLARMSVVRVQNPRFSLGDGAPGRDLPIIKIMTCPPTKLTLVAVSIGNLVMLRKQMIALAAATLWSLAVPQAASAGYYCYGDGAAPGSARCAGVGLGLRSPRWYYSDNYPYYIYFYSGHPYYAFRDVVGGCYLIRRPVLTPQVGWRTGTVEVCD
jgi:hypothetical protein